MIVMCLEYLILTNNMSLVHIFLYLVLKRKQKSKRKRKLLIDAVKELSRVHMQKQLVNFEDTVTTLSIAPPTRKLMIFQEMGSVDKLMNRPVQPLLNEDLLVVTFYNFICCFNVAINPIDASGIRF